VLEHRQEHLLGHVLPLAGVGQEVRDECDQRSLVPLDEGPERLRVPREHPVDDSRLVHPELLQPERPGVPGKTGFGLSSR